MATQITFPIYIKDDKGEVFTKLISPYEMVEVIVGCATMISRVKIPVFTDTYNRYLNDECMYSNKNEFEMQFQSATRIISPEFFVILNQFHVN